jgi:hypothetical protein
MLPNSFTTDFISTAALKPEHQHALKQSQQIKAYPLAPEKLYESEPETSHRVRKRNSTGKAR